MKQLNLIFFLFVLSLARITAQVNSPAITCVSVAANGDVTVSWSTPADPLNQFVSYDVYSSSNLNGPYSLLSSVNTYASTSYTYVGAAANVAPKFFYVQTTSTGPVSQPATDTVKSIFLTVINPANGTAALSWNPISSPLSATSSSSYTIYREYPTGVFSVIGTTTGLSHIDTIDVCSAVINYKIEISDASGCNSVSNVTGGPFIDGIPPNKPLFDSISINAAGQAIIGLQPSSSPDAKCYIIYQHTGPTVIAIDTVCGNVPTLYTNLNSSAGGGVETYDIASIDSCGNVCTHSLLQNTLFVSGQYNLCARSIVLGWNSYKNMTGGLKEYQVMVSVNGSSFSLAGTAVTNTFNHPGLTPGSTYCYIIRAVNTTGTVTSSSNKVCVVAKAQSEPSYVYVKKVSVNPSQNVDVEFSVDNTAHIRSVNVYASDKAAGPFRLLANVPFTGASNYVLSDNNVSTADKNYYYYAQVIDSCGLPGITSNTSKTIVLHVTSNQYFTNTLEWDDYSLFLGNVASYNIYRSVDGAFDPSPVGNVPFGLTTYVDDVSAFVPNQGKFSYYVQAVEGAGDPLSFMETSNSNVVDAYKEEDIFIPNAFAPKGVNKVFLPITQYVEKTDYKVMIFNRFGNKIWQTESDSEGWDGSHCEEGVYVYMVQYKNSIGEFKEYKGTVTLVR